MVLLVEKISKFCSKLDNHHHHHHHFHHKNPPDAFSDSLESFRSNVSNSLNRILSNSKPGIEIPSLEWIRLCFEILPSINGNFAKLVVDIDYPMNRWEAASMEEYLNYSLNLLEVLNCISSSLSHLGLSRLPLLHALNLLENSPFDAIKHLKAIKVESFYNPIKKMGNGGDGGEKFCSGKEKIIRKAMKEMRSTGIWVCGVLLACLSGNANSYSEINKSGAESNIPSLIELESGFSQVMVEKNGELKEVMELNRAASSLKSTILERKSNDAAADELEKKLNVFEKSIDDLSKDVDDLFSKVLASRNGLLHSVK